MCVRARIAGALQPQSGSVIHNLRLPYSVVIVVVSLWHLSLGHKGHNCLVCRERHLHSLRGISLGDIQFLPTRSKFALFQGFLNFSSNAPKFQGMCILLKSVTKGRFRNVWVKGGQVTLFLSTEAELGRGAVQSV